MPADDFIITPWHVEGDIDYDKLIKRFGTEKISLELLKIESRKILVKIIFMLRRGIFFSHREMNRILDDYEKGNKFFLYTGRGPIRTYSYWTFGTMDICKMAYKRKFDVNMYFQLTDDEKFYSKSNLTLEDTKQSLHMKMH